MLLKCVTVDIRLPNMSGNQMVEFTSHDTVASMDHWTKSLVTKWSTLSHDHSVSGLVKVR